MCEARPSAQGAHYEEPSSPSPVSTVLADWWHEPSKGQVAAGRPGSLSSSQSWMDTMGSGTWAQGNSWGRTCRHSRAQGTWAQGTSWSRTDIVELRIHSQGLEEVHWKSKFLRGKKTSKLGICKRQEATREQGKCSFGTDKEEGSASRTARRRSQSPGQRKKNITTEGNLNTHERGQKKGDTHTHEEGKRSVISQSPPAHRSDH